MSSQDYLDPLCLKPHYHLHHSTSGSDCAFASKKHVNGNSEYCCLLPLTRNLSPVVSSTLLLDQKDYPIML